MKRFGSGVLLFAAALLLVPSLAAAQTTGRIYGQLVDAQGAAVPGATVTVSGPAVQGTLTQVTDGEGNFRFPVVPPGRYTVKAELSGFKTLEQANVDVGLDRTVTLNWRMDVAGVAETVTVQGQSVIIDTTSTTSGVNVGTEEFNRLPVRRDFYAATRFAPGVTEDAVGPVVAGSTGAENQYIIDGLNTTGVELGDKQKQLNFDFIQEVEVKTGGLAAEYGRMTGGVVNVITKSGSNNFRGSVFGFAEGGGLQSNNSTGPDRPTWQTQVTDISSQADGGGELGGFIARDKLWFFGAYNRVRQGLDTTVIRELPAGSPSLGTAVPTTITRDLYAAKLTAKAGNNNTLNATIMGDPSTRDGVLFAIAGPESTFKGERETGANDFVGRYDGVFGSSFLLQAQVARHNERDNTLGPGRDIPQFIDQTVNPVTLDGGFGFFQDQKFSRNVAKADVTSFLGINEIKAGVDWEHVQADNNNFNGGAGQRIYKFRSSAGVIYYRHRFYLDDRAPGFSRTDRSTWVLSLPLHAEPDSTNTSFYVQDSIRIGNALTINAGIRWEGQDVRDRDGNTSFSLKDNWAPRIGFIYDVARNGRSKLFANWGRFFESIPMDINIRSFGGEVQCFCYNFTPDPAVLTPDPAAPARSSLLGGATPADPDLKGQYIDEWIGGFEYQLENAFVVGAKIARRNLGRVIEDFLVPSAGEYFVANPGVGFGSEMSFYDYTPIAAPKPRRVNTSFELSARKRFSANWQFIASAVFAKLEGNYDGTFQVSTGQLDPNINSAFDYADFLVNADGRLSNDRAFQFKLDGSYEVPSGAAQGLNLGFSTRVFSGLPLNAYGYSRAYQNWEYYLVPRGSVGRGPKDWEADIHVGYPVKVGTRSLNLIADVFNLFDRQAITVLDERYNIVANGTCAGIPDCNGDGGHAVKPGTLEPAVPITDPRATAPNADYLKKGISFTGQRSIRVGARFSF